MSKKDMQLLLALVDRLSGAQRQEALDRLKAPNGNAAGITSSFDHLVDELARQGKQADGEDARQTQGQRGRGQGGRAEGLHSHERHQADKSDKFPHVATPSALGPSSAAAESLEIRLSAGVDLPLKRGVLVDW